MKHGDVFVFDIDGTLTPPRQSMSKDFEEVFNQLVCKEDVYLVSGSDIAKIREQVPEHILSKCKGVFGSSGNELWVDNTEIYKKSYNPKKSLTNKLESFLSESSYETKTGKHIEHRPGMINFSIVGRNATLKQRKDYHKWDKKSQERKKMAILLMASNPEITVSVGGEISIDIYPRGLDKSQAISYIKEEYGEKYKKINFFGDKTSPDGNDYSAVCALSELDKVYPVDNCNQTLEILQTFLEK